MMSDFAKEVLDNLVNTVVADDTLKKVGIVQNDNNLCKTTHLMMIYNAALRMEIFSSEQRNNINGLYHRLMYK